MKMSVISFEQAKELTLARLKQWLEELPEAERRRPRKIIDFKAYSVLDLIREVEMETETGKKIIYDEMKRLNYVVE
jgi:hypothetical protein